MKERVEFCLPGTGGHTEYIELYENGILIANGKKKRPKNGNLDEILVVRSWKNIRFCKAFCLQRYHCHDQLKSLYAQFSQYFTFSTDGGLSLFIIANVFT